MRSGRRNLLIGGAALAGIAVMQRLRPRGPELAFEPMADFPGFRRLTSGAGGVSAGLSGSALLFAGLGPEPTDLDRAAEARVRADPCAILFRGAPAPAIAYFTDIRCPICRPLERDLDQLAAAHPGLHRVTHEYPVFGESSELAARALVAAGPDLAPRLRARLAAAPVVVTESYLRQVIRSLDADPEPVLAAMTSDGTETQLAESRAIGRAFGFPGTPSLVIGSTVIVGALPAASLAEILSQEADRQAIC